MQLQWGTLLEQARANHAQACANQATAEAVLMPSGMVEMEKWRLGCRMLMVVPR